MRQEGGKHGTPTAIRKGGNIIPERGEGQEAQEDRKRRRTTKDLAIMHGTGDAC